MSIYCYLHLGDNLMVWIFLFYLHQRSMTVTANLLFIWDWRPGSNDSTLSKGPELEAHHQMQFIVMASTKFYDMEENITHIYH